jgi:hypothetical protein
VLLVLAGMWNGKMVAVKVLEYLQQQNEDGCLLEGLLSEQVQHPHVVSAGGSAGDTRQHIASACEGMLATCCARVNDGVCRF